ncbi:MAG: hypothetical protein HY294_00225 [Candidatus Rokubacteria bacterium]|nr:hypothetical protein [Candidatus Rokubacteria bacterium]MBI3824405.1 hypothetical protein [Candidatus Rokubacteria bacterium]
MITARPGRDQRGLGFVELLLTLVVVVLCGYFLMQYVGSTTKTVETFKRDRPLAGAKLVADQGTILGIGSTLRVYQAEHGQWPADKAAVLALLPSPPRFQCQGNDFEYDPGSGALRLLIADPTRCE